jgi:GntR family transcriptional regulator, transcriptional repressor for pyruvate dehydrogenase complex
MKGDRSPSGTRLSVGAQAAVFAPLEPTGRAEAVARRLAEAIALGLLPDAQQLPSETDLAERLGVATVTVREALTSLREQGLVRTRRGRGGGSFVCAPDDPLGSVLLGRLRRLGLGDLRDLTDHYAAISGAAARLAAERADPDDLARLRASTDRLARAGEIGARRRIEGQYHLELAAGAQSPRLTKAELALQAELGPLLWLPYHQEPAVEAACRRHREVQDAVGRGDPAGARSAAEQHVGDLFEALRDLHRGSARR